MTSPLLFPESYVPVTVLDGGCQVGPIIFHFSVQLFTSFSSELHMQNEIKDVLEDYNTKTLKS